MLMNIVINCYRRVWSCTHPKSQESRQRRARAHTRAHQHLLGFIWLVRSWRADVWRARPNALRVSHISGSVGSPQLLSVCRRRSILWSCNRDPRGSSVWISGRAPCPPGTAQSVRSCPRSARMLCPCWQSAAPGACLQPVRPNLTALCTYNFHMTVWLRLKT